MGLSKQQRKLQERIDKKTLAYYFLRSSALGAPDRAERLSMMDEDDNEAADEFSGIERKYLDVILSRRAEIKAFCEEVADDSPVNIEGSSKSSKSKASSRKRKAYSKKVPSGKENLSKQHGSSQAASSSDEQEPSSEDKYFDEDRLSEEAYKTFLDERNITKLELKIQAKQPSAASEKAIDLNELYQKLSEKYQEACLLLRKEYRDTIRLLIDSTDLKDSIKRDMRDRTDLQFNIIDAEIELISFTRQFPMEADYDEDQRQYYSDICKKLAGLCSRLSQYVDDDSAGGNLKRIGSQRMSYAYQRMGHRLDKSTTNHEWLRLAECFEGLSHEYELIGDHESSAMTFQEFIDCLRFLSGLEKEKKRKSKILRLIADHYYRRAMLLYESGRSDSVIRQAHAEFYKYLREAEVADRGSMRVHIQNMRYINVRSIMVRNDAVVLLAEVQRSLQYWFRPSRLLNALLTFNRLESAAMLNSSKGDMFNVSQKALVRYFKLLTPLQINALFEKIIKDKRFIRFFHHLQFLVDNPLYLNVTIPDEKQVMFHDESDRSDVFCQKSPEEKLEEQVGNFLFKILNLASIIPNALDDFCESIKISIGKQHTLQLTSGAVSVRPKKSNDTYKWARNAFFAIREGRERFLIYDTELAQKKKVLLNNDQPLKAAAGADADNLNPSKRMLANHL